MLEDKCEENRVPKNVELTLQKKIKWARTKQKRWKKELRELENKKNDEKWETNEKTMKNDLSWNDPWSDHPETQFGPTYSFFRSPEPRPTLCT